MALQLFKNDFPKRYIDVGVAEQNLAGIAAGLALEGNIPVIMGMIPFMSMRSCEQIRTAICYQNLPVRFVGTGGGLTSSGGSTHNAMEDIAIMKSMVNMTVLSVGDPNMIRDILISSMTYEGPIFIRLAQGKKDKVIYSPEAADYQIGRAITARKGRDYTVVTHGEMVFRSLRAAEILEQEGIDLRVIDMFTIKPLDCHVIEQAAAETKGILVLEDHLMAGGLASSVADFLVDSNIRPKSFKRMGIPQIYAGFGESDELHKKYGYDLESVLESIRILAA